MQGWWEWESNCLVQPRCRVTSLPISSFHQSPVPFIFQKTPISLVGHSLEPSA